MEGGSQNGQTGADADTSNETTSRDTEWQSQKHKQSKRSLLTTPTTPSSQQDKKPKLFFSPNRFSILSENETDKSEHDATNKMK
jgi:hypothetical protein